MKFLQLAFLVAALIACSSFVSGQSDADMMLRAMQANMGMPISALPQRGPDSVNGDGVSADADVFGNGESSSMSCNDGECVKKVCRGNVCNKFKCDSDGNNCTPL